VQLPWTRSTDPHHRLTATAEMKPLAAKAMGYDFCPMIGFMIAVGKAAH
jgi:hypothetical protein